MKVQWNNCFLCLNDLGNGRVEQETASKKRRKVRKCIGKDPKPNRADTVLLLNYLLYTKCKKYSGLIDNVVQLIKHEETTENTKKTSSSHDIASVRFCDGCEAHLKTVSELHRELEVVQMKLVHVIKSLQSTVVRNSKRSNGESNGEGCHGVGLDIFENWLMEQEKEPLEDGKSQLKQQRKILNTLYAFQEAVVENVQSSIVIPRVFLKKITEFKPHLTVNSSGIVIKTETEAIDFDENNMPSPEEPDWFSENFDNEPQKPKRRERKRKTKESKITSVDVKLKDENDDDGIIPTKKVRSASFVARLRISASKIKKQKKSKIKKEKTEPPRKQRARILQPFRLKPDSEKRKFYKPNLYWACATCPFASRNIYHFEHHLRSHEVAIGEDNATSSNAPLFRCEKCENLTFSVQQHYQFHNACHDGAISMPCEICSVACEPFALVEHMKSHIERIFPCPNCSFCCSTRENYLEHLKFHKNSNVHKCDICLETCTSRVKLFDHYDKEHQVLEKQTCDAYGCTKEFLDPEDLKRHKYNFHENSFVCQHCAKVLSSAHSLEQHLALHTGEKPFACGECSEAFSCKANLNRHMVSQHEAPKVKCEYCEKEYAEMSTLKIHMAQVHTGSDFVCDFPQCGKIFGTGSLLKRHKAIHFPERNFSCEECGKRFKLAQDVKKHMRNHFGEKKFKCQYCEKTFLYEKYLTQHIRIHTGEKPFVCDSCGSAFNQYAALYIHKRNCHLRN